MCGHKESPKPRNGVTKQHVIVTNTSELATVLPAERSGEALPFTDDEEKELVSCEQVFADRRRPFYEWGRALATIKKGRLFQASHKSFEMYCRERWRISRIHAYRLIKASEVVYQSLLPAGNIRLPTREQHVRPLVHLHRKLVQTVWRQVVEDAGSTQITARQVMDAIGKFDQRGNRSYPHLHKKKRLNRSPISCNSSLAEADVHLTERQVRVLELVRQGFSNKQIAERLRLSQYTVQNHLRNIYARIGAHCRTEAILSLKD